MQESGDVGVPTESEEDRATIGGEIRLNVNQRCRVKLTELGIRHYREHWRRYGIEAEPKTDADGWYRDQLWSVMSIFGDALFCGGRIPFETEIVVEPDNFLATAQASASTSLPQNTDDPKGIE